MYVFFCENLTSSIIQVKNKLCKEYKICINKSSVKIKDVKLYKKSQKRVEFRMPNYKRNRIAKQYK